MNEKLLPCPFCGSVSPDLLYGYAFISGYKDARQIKCGRCGAEGPVGEGKSGATIKWNNRWMQDICVSCMDCV